MSHSLSRVFVHLVWATKRRSLWIAPSHDRLIHSVIRDRCNRTKTTLIAIGCADDHVHLLVRLSLTAAVAGLVRACKTASSSALRTGGRMPGFEWQVGYGAMSIEADSVPAVAEYVIHQRSRHAEGSVNADLEAIDRADDPSASPR